MCLVMTTRDRLLLLKPGFEDPAFPGQRFYCWHCALIEGLLASFPELAARLDVERIDWERPRAAVVTVLGLENQTLPVLLLADDGVTAPGARAHAGQRFIDDKDGILRALSARHGFPLPHP
jgi:Protein of unknown function (DUF3088)